MVSAQFSPESASRTGSFTRRPRIRARSNFQRLLITGYRLASIEVRLWLLQAQRSVQKLILAAVCASIGLVAAVLGTIFLYIFLFNLLAHAIGSRWTFLIFALVHLAAAAGLFVYASRTLHAKPPADEPGDVPLSNTHPL